MRFEKGNVMANGSDDLTGRSLVAVDPDLPASRIDAFVSWLGSLQVKASLGPFPLVDIEKFTELGIAVVPLPPTMIEALLEAFPFAGVSVGPERALRIPSGGDVIGVGSHANILDAMNVKTTPSGAVKVCVLDTGYAPHPDFNGRVILSDPLGTNTTMDTRGHGMQCIGLACGPLAPYDGSKRYGMAYGSTILNGHVVSVVGVVCDCTIIRGIQWAAQQGAAVVNISAGTTPYLGGYSAQMEAAALRAKRNNVLVIAAAGNNSEGVGNLPVTHPANCPSIMAVAALDHQLKPWKYSCMTVYANQRVDIAAPGEMIRTSYLNGGFKELSGTSAASALVSGVAALWASTNLAYRGQALWDVLIAKALPMTGQEPQVGAGMVQAP